MGKRYNNNDNNNPFKTVFLLSKFEYYLPGRGDTMITNVVFPGLGLSIALWVY